MADALPEVTQDFEANTTAYVAALLAAAAAANDFAAANRDAVVSLAGLQAAIDAVHGKDVSLGVDVAGAAAAAEAQARLAQAVAATGAADATTAVAAAAVAAAQDKQGASATAAAAGLSAFQLGLYGGHVALTTFGAVLAGVVTGFIAFGIAAVDNIGPVIKSLSTLTTSYGQLDNYQKAAALSLKSFMNSLGGSEAGVFTVFNQFLGLITSHMQAAGGVTQQATIAFMDFGAMLQQQFSSAGWASLFARQSGLVRSSLDALFGMINNLIGVIPALFHNFAFLGIGALNLVSDLLRLVAVVGNFDPTLTRWAAGIATVAAAYHLLSNAIGFLPTMSALFARTGLNAISATGALKNFREFGLIPTLSFMTGITPAAFAAAGALTVMIGGFVAAADWMGTRVPQSVNTLIASLTAQDHAVGDNAAGYAKLASQLGAYGTAVQQAIRTQEGVRPSLASVTNAVDQVNTAQQQASQTAQTLNSNFAYLERTYGLTAQQAYQLAQATGINMKQSLTASGTAAAENRSKIAAYEQTVANAGAVERQFAFDMQQATNTSLGMVARLQGLTAAFQVLSGATLQAMNASAAFKQSLATLQQAARAAGDQVGVNTQKQAALTAALAVSAQAAMADSTAILNNTHSAQAAVAPLMAMRDEILRLGLDGKAAAALVAQLNAEIAALKSKTVTETVIIQTLHQGGASAPTRPGMASGSPLVPSGAHLVGEFGPELIMFGGGERVVPAGPTAQMLRGGGGPSLSIGELHVHGNLLTTKAELHSLIQQAFLDIWTRTRGTGIVPTGYGLR